MAAFIMESSMGCLCAGHFGSVQQIRKEQNMGLIKAAQVQ